MGSLTQEEYDVWFKNTFGYTEAQRNELSRAGEAEAGLTERRDHRPGEQGNHTTAGLVHRLVGLQLSDSEYGS